MGYNPEQPIFADQYSFEPVGPDWDRGRSGLTHLVNDLTNNRKGVLKRAETSSKQASMGLKNEVAALKALEGLGVPKVYDFGKADYDSKTYDYLVLEYIDGDRVEKEITSLPSTARAEILARFLGLLSQAHRKGILNGDVDIKHLFWRKERRNESEKLIVIDWGNAVLHVDKSKKTEFAYDLARTAEIIYSLVVGKHPPATGSIALPEDSKLIPGLAPLPFEFREICQWAPRTPTKGAKAPRTAAELFDKAAKWKSAIEKQKPYRARQPFGFKSILLISVLIGLVILSGAVVLNVPNLIFPPDQLTSTISATNTILPDTDVPTDNATKPASETPAVALSLSATQSLTPGQEIIPSPKTYSPMLIFDNQSTGDGCWVNTLNGTADFKPREAFKLREDGYRSFVVADSRTREDVMQTEFGDCIDIQNLSAISMNVWVSQIDANREFGYYLEDVNGNRREYTIWLERVGDNNKMYLRLREEGGVTDYELLITNNLKFTNAFPHLYYQFSFLAFFEINNDGLDILYLQEGPPLKAVAPNEIDPNQLIRADNAVRTTLGELKSIGLIGYGGQIETVIWPLVFLSNE